VKRERRLDRRRRRLAEIRAAIDAGERPLSNMHNRTWAQRDGVGEEIQALLYLEQVREELRKARDAALVDARQAGYTWDELALALGVTRQAVKKRFDSICRTVGSPSGHGQEG
jgi:DNA invertase Pin-like site-specific DNA recombinase